MKKKKKKKNGGNLPGREGGEEEDKQTSIMSFASIHRFLVACLEVGQSCSNPGLMWLDMGFHRDNAIYLPGL